MKGKAVMLFKKNMEYLHGLGKDFFNKTQKPLAIKERTDKFDYIKMKNFCHQRAIYKKKNEKKSQSGRRYCLFCNICFNNAGKFICDW